MLRRFLLFILSALVLCGCTRIEDREELVFSSWGSVTEVGILKTVIKDFERDNPDIRIKFVHIPQNYFQKLHLLFASNTAPDVIFINNLYIPVYADFLEDLTGMVDYADYFSQAIEGLSYGGKLLAVPRDVSNLVFYVNYDLIGAEPKALSMERLLDFARKVSVKGAFGIGAEEDVYWMLPYLKYFGGDILDEKFSLAIDSIKSRGAVEFYKGLSGTGIAPKKSEVGSSTLAQMFLDKKLGFYLSGRWMYPKISENADFNWGVVVFPSGAELQPCDVSGWAVSKSSEHKQSAYRFVKYLSGVSVGEYFTTTGLVVPARIELSKHLDKVEHNERAFVDAVKGSKKTNVNKGYRKLVDEINSKLFF